MVGVGPCMELGAGAKGQDEGEKEKERCCNDVHGADECNAILESNSHQKQRGS